MRSPVLAGALATLLAVTLGAAAVRAGDPSETSQDDAAVEAACRAAIARVSPSIVEVETLGAMPEKVEPPKGEGEGGSEGVLARKGFKQAFGPSTGVAVGKELVVTSSFCLQREPRHVFVTRHDGKAFVARVLGRDDSRQIVLLEVKGADLIAAPAARRDSVKVGRYAIALGRGLGVPAPAVSLGVVSATDRIGGRAMQTSAAVSPANYGGPLVSLDGEVMGVLAPLAPAGGMAGVDLYDSGIGFAVPLEDVTAVLPRLVKGERLKPGFLGVAVDQGRTEDGVLLETVAPGSPAEKAGLRAKDVIVEVDGKPVEAYFQLQHGLGRKVAGDEVTLKVERGGKAEVVTVKLGEPPPPPPPGAHPGVPGMPGGPPGPGPGRPDKDKDEDR